MRILSAVLHPVLLAVFPILFLLANNLDTFRLDAARFPCAVAALGALAVWGIVAAISRDARKAGFLVSLFLLVFFSFEHLRRLGIEAGIPATAAGVAVGIALLLLLGVAMVVLARSRADLRLATRAFNTAAALLVGISLGRIANHELRARVPALEPNTTLSDTRVYAERARRDLPDVYYIVLDGYGRQDVLLERFGYDNGELLRYLEAKGFFVARRARANYSQTALSLAATLNMDYVQRLLPGMRGRRDLAPLERLIQENRVFQQLRELGYKVVTFPTASDITRLKRRDVHFDGSTRNEFEAGLLGLTPLPFLARLIGAQDNAVLDPYEAHRRSVLFKFEKIMDLSELSRPIVVFAHFLSPHPPFVFSADGQRVEPVSPFSIRERDHAKGYVEGYAAQLGFIDGKLRELVDAILERSSPPPIIVIQGDHGPASAWLQFWQRNHRWNTRDPQVYRERLTVLNAIHLSGGEESPFYDGVSLVNTFRLILNHDFGGRLAPLPDESFFSEYDAPYGFSNVTRLLDRTEAAASE
jgi:hypothetical protein